MGKPILNEKTILDYMKRNKCNREEAIELINYDIAIENDEATEYDLTEEQKKNVQEMTRKIEHAKSGPRKVNRKPNELKEGIIAELAEFLAEDAQQHLYEDVIITNSNRMIHFKVNEKEFDLQLIEKRGPHKKQ